MKDSFGREIEYLRLSITDRCNLRCRYCMPEDGLEMQPHDAILNYEELLRIAVVADRLGVCKIRLTGGEPLVRRGLVEFVAQLAQLPGRPELTLTTNGLLLAQYARPLQQAGLSRVNVSLDTLRPERFLTITRREGLEQVLAGLDEAMRAGLTPIKVNMVPLLGVNHDEIADFARLAMERNCEIRFIEYMPVGSGLDYSPAQRYPADRILADLQALGALEPQARTGPAGPARLYRYAGGRGRVGVIPAVSEHFCRECNRLRVTADGQIKTCLFSREDVDLRGALRQGATDEELAGILRLAIAAKPERHAIGDADFTPGGRCMHGIGG